MEQLRRSGCNTVLATFSMQPGRKSDWVAFFAPTTVEILQAGLDDVLAADGSPTPLLSHALIAHLNFQVIMHSRQRCLYEIKPVPILSTLFPPQSSSAGYSNPLLLSSSGFAVGDGGAGGCSFGASDGGGGGGSSTAW
jgi:uncharacterized membrane protein YgcG